MYFVSLMQVKHASRSTRGISKDLWLTTRKHSEQIQIVQVSVFLFQSLFINSGSNNDNDYS